MAEVLHGNANGNQLNAAENRTQVYGLAGNDTLTSDGKSDVLLIGGSGDDSLIMSGGNATLSGGTGKDTFELNYSATKKLSVVIEDIDPTNDLIVVNRIGDTAPQLSYTVNGDEVVWTDDRGDFSLTLRSSSESEDYFDGEAHEYIWDILHLVNQERENAGLNALILSQDLTEGAGIRSQELIINYSHTRPDGTSCFTAITKSYGGNGENIYESPSSPEAAMEGWMNSIGHRANILRDYFENLGVGYTYDDNSQWKHYWVQTFGGELLNTTNLSVDEILNADISTNTIASAPIIEDTSDSIETITDTTTDNSGSTFTANTTTDNSVSTSPTNNHTMKIYAPRIYAGGDQIISDYQSGEQIVLGTMPTGWIFGGGNFALGSATGNLFIANANDKVINFMDATGNSFLKAYSATNAGTIDGRGLAGYEYIVGSDTGADIIFAGDGGSQLWGGNGLGADALIGGAGTDMFMGGKYQGADVFANASSADVVNLNDTTLSDIVAANESNNIISLAFNTGNVIAVGSSELLSAAFVLADGSAWRFNHATKSWQGA